MFLLQGAQYRGLHLPENAASLGVSFHSALFCGAHPGLIRIWKLDVLKALSGPAVLPSWSHALLVPDLLKHDA